MPDFKKLKSVVEGNNSFLITTHVNPDADAIGSEMAVYYLLKKLGKTVLVYNHSATPYNLKFLDKDDVIKKFNPETDNKIFNSVDVIVFVDLNQAIRVRSMERGIRASDKIKVCIDHHQNPENFFDHLFVDADYSATGEIIYDFIKATAIVEFDYDIALQIYSAIMTDTGSFRFNKTTPKIHKIAAHLIELGVDPSYVYDSIYEQGQVGKLQLLGEALSSFKLNSTNEIGYILITQKALLETNSTEEDVDGFVNYCLSIQGVKVGLLFFELKDGVKISFRSKGSIPVNQLAAEFNGGGHTNAAGARLFNAGFEETINKVIKSAEAFLNKIKN